MRDKDILRAAVGGISRKFAERPLGFMHAGEYLAFNDYFRAGGNFEILDPAAREAVGLTEEAADDLELTHLWRISVEHRAHIKQRGGAQRGRPRERGAPPPRA